MNKIKKQKVIGFLILSIITLIVVTCNNEELESTADEGAITDDSALVGRGASPKKNVTYFIKTRKSGKYLDVASFSHKNGGKIHQWSKTGRDNQRWKVKPAGGSDFRIKNVESGKSFQIAGNSKKDKALLHQWSYDGDNNQKVTFRDVGGGYYAIIFKHSGKALDNNGETSRGTSLWQYTYNNKNQNQHFLFEPVSGGDVNDENDGG